MWRRIVNWYDEIDKEQQDVLRQPDLAAQVRPGYRRKVANHIAALSPIEREQLLAFLLAYRGRRLHLAFTKLILVFCVAGVCLHLALPEKTTWHGAIIIANLLGFMLTGSVLSTWFGYRQMIREYSRRVRLGVVFGLLPLTLFYGYQLMTSDAPSERLTDVASGFIFVLVGAALISVPLYALAFMRNRQYEAQAARHQQEAERERMARELSESRLRLLHAQIEPHFLFNTLGAVQQLAEHGAPRAAQLTANLITFLRSSLDEMRSERVSLSAEFGLVEAYLRVMEARLGSRLHFMLSLPEQLAQVRIPSMILLTLVENAIKHGIEPSLRGGEVSVRAEALGQAIRIRVQDSGVGMGSAPGSGLGLDNVRSRLRLAFGDAAGIKLHDADPGVVADVTIPHSTGQQ